VLRESFDSFAVDTLGYVYLVKDELLLKYNPAGKQLARYSNLKYGDIAFVDVTNPLKLLIYYKEFQQIVMLDNQLSPHKEAISLEQLGLEQSRLVCTSANNSMWVFNNQNNELIRFNEAGQKISATGNLKQILRREIKPVFMVEQNSDLYLVCPEEGIFVFDMFGTFTRVVPKTRLSRVDVDGTIIYYQENSALCSYNIDTFEQTCTQLDSSANFRTARYNGVKLYLDYSDSLIVKSP